MPPCKTCPLVSGFLTLIPSHPNQGIPKSPRNTPVQPVPPPFPAFLPAPTGMAASILPLPSQHVSTSLPLTVRHSHHTFNPTGKATSAHCDSSGVMIPPAISHTHRTATVLVRRSLGGLCRLSLSSGRSRQRGTWANGEGGCIRWLWKSVCGNA